MPRSIYRPVDHQEVIDLYLGTLMTVPEICAAKMISRQGLYNILRRHGIKPYRCDSSWRERALAMKRQGMSGNQIAAKCDRDLTYVVRSIKDMEGSGIV